MRRGEERREDVTKERRQGDRKKWMDEEKKVKRGRKQGK